MKTYSYAYIAEIATAVGLWISYHVLKILLERNYSPYFCPLCESYVASR